MTKVPSNDHPYVPRVNFAIREKRRLNWSLSSTNTDESGEENGAVAEMFG